MIRPAASCMSPALTCRAIRLLALVVACLGVAGLITPTSQAGIIDFETRPNGTIPADDSALANPYNIDGGGTVRFFFDANRNNAYDAGTDILPIFEATGRDGNDGFVASQVGPNAYDRARPGYEGQLGNFFLRQPDGIGPVPAPFVIAYDTTQMIREFSGEIWDIDGADGTEQWRVDALNSSGSVLATLLSPLGVDASVNSLDSLPWDFAFTNLPDGVKSVRLTFVGSKTDGVGLAFNNFSPTFAVLASVPEPSSVIMLGLGAIGLLAHGWPRRGRAA